MIDHSNCAHPSTPDGRGGCRAAGGPLASVPDVIEEARREEVNAEARTMLRDRLAVMPLREREVVGMVLDLSDYAERSGATTDDLRDLLDEAHVRSNEPAPDADGGRDPIVRIAADPTDRATVGDLIDHLNKFNRGRPVMLITRDGASWMNRVRDDHTGAIDLIGIDVDASTL